MNDELLFEIQRVVIDGDVEQARKLLLAHPEAVHYISGAGGWLHWAATSGNIPMAAMLLEFGCDINAEYGVGLRVTPLARAIREKHVEMVSFLLQRGADPNHNYEVVKASIADAHSLEIVKLLEQHGGNLNCEFVHSHLKRTMNPLAMAVAYGRGDVAEYLRSRGCTMPSEPPPKRAKSPKSLDEEIVGHFREHLGPVAERSLMEIVPSDPPIAVHVIPSGGDRKSVTLFTTGMSSRAMKVQRGGDANYTYAELFVQLPGSWKWELIEDLKWGWPIHWLRSMGKYPHQKRSWLGGPTLVVANGDPPVALAPNVEWTSLLLFAETSFVASKKRTIQLYRLCPLFTEERALEAKAGTAALFRAFDKHNVSFVIDPKRPNVAK